MENGRESDVIGAIQRRFWILWNYVYANCRPTHTVDTNF